MSLDGYISGPAESGFEHLFHVSEASARHFRDIVDNTGAIVVGRWSR